MTPSDVLQKLREFPLPAGCEFSVSTTFEIHQDEQWPNAHLPGVYMLFDELLNFLYVGKASMYRNTGERIGRHADIAAKYVITATFLPEWSYEAPALEEFLIKHLNPPKNKNGTKKEKGEEP